MAHLVFLECGAQNPKNVVKNDIKKGAKVKAKLSVFLKTVPLKQI